MKPGFKALFYFSSGILVTSLIVFGLAFKKTNTEGSVDVKQQEGRLQYKWYAPALPGTISFAGEKVPLDRVEIREQLDREMLYNYYNFYSTLYIIKLTTRYFPIIEDHLRANGVPDDFKYLCVAESALQNQTSKVGAVGFWQFMKDTAPRYGLQVDDEVDERYNVARSTDAACLYFKEAYAKFGSWTAAAASYNCGEGGYNTQATYQRTTNYYNLLLADETMRYVFRILALKFYITQAEKMGFIIQAPDAYKPYQVHPVTISATIPDLAQYAIDKGITYRTLKMYNPWLRGHTLTVLSGKTYEIQLPEGVE